MPRANPRPTESETDVMIVGAGPTGLTLAAELMAYGARFRLVDRLLDRVHESRALGVQPRTLEVLAPLGVTDELIERGNRAVLLRMHFGRRITSMRLFDIGIDDTAYPYLLFISQAETDRILGQRLSRSGRPVERGVELVGFSQSSDVVRCQLRHPDQSIEIVHARYVVGCDGAHSTVREQAGIRFEGGTYPQTFVLADLEAAGLDPGAAHVFVSGHGLLFFFPLGQPATWRLLAMRPRTDENWSERPVILAEVQALADAYTDRTVRLRDPVWMTNFRLHNRGAARYRAGRVFLAGDAAHIHSPAGAQGMNTGIQDSVNLGWKLGLVVAGRAAPELLDSYEPERAPVGRLVLRFTDRIFTIATSRNPLIRFARTQLAPRFAPLALRVNAARSTGFRIVSQLAIRYRDSPLSGEGPGAPRNGARAGDRLPDAPVTRDGRRTTLHRALAAPGFHLLLCNPTNAWPAAVDIAWFDRYSDLVTVHRLIRSHDDPLNALADSTGLAMDRLGVNNRAAVHCLVRPDGHVAYRGGADLTGVRAYLAHWLLGAS